jgi:long-chain acyl-CoA synthetase
VSEIIGRFAERRRREPGRPLVHLPAAGRTLSVSSLWESHLHHVERLNQLGLERHQLIVSAAGNHPVCVSLLMACRALDLVMMPVDGGTKLREILELGNRFGAAALVLPAALASGVDGRSAPLTDDLTIVLHETPARQYAGAAMLKLTSGTTDVPKAALVTEAHLLADCSHVVSAMDIREEDTQIACIPLSHSYGIVVMLMPLLVQATALVLRESFVPKELPADARRFSARRFPGVPFMFDYFIAHPPGDGWPRCLQHLISAGARLEPATVRTFFEMFGVKIHTFYGTTETGGISFDDSDRIEAAETVGRPLPGVTVSLRPDAGAPRGAGRIFVQSGSVADGYAGQPSDTLSYGGFLTGDYGAFDDRGCLTLVGRASSFVNVAGRKVEPSEVEVVLRSMPGIADVRVVGAPDAQRGQQIVACVVTDYRHVQLTTVAIRQFCASRLSPHKIPRAILFLDSIPLTARGKTDRSALADLVRERLAETS